MGTFSWIVLAAVAAYLAYTTYKRYKTVKNYDPSNESSKLQTLTDANFKKSIAKGVVLVDFWAPWCAPCRMLAPTISELADDFDGKATIAKINIDENKKTAASYGIRSIPTLIVFKDGEPVQKITGVKSKSTFSNAINKQL